MTPIVFGLSSTLHFEASMTFISSLEELKRFDADKTGLRAIIHFSIETSTMSISESQRDYLRLALVHGIGPKMMTALLDRFTTAGEVLKASLSQLHEVERVGPKLASAIQDSRYSDYVDRVIEHSQANQIRIVTPTDEAYPRLLKEIADPPLVLFMRGELKPADQLSVAIVGSRHATSYGRTATEMLASGLARAGLTIVSGLARGIDGYAHQAAIDAGGRTIAFLGSSIAAIYPAEHEELARQVEAHGALMSETDPFTKPKPGVFPQRNRLISGFSLCVIVVEAADRSGALITATHAGEQGRDLFAVPGPINARMSRGCNRLIRDGAILVQSPQDVLEHLGPLVDPACLAPDRVVRHPAELQLNDQEQHILQSIDDTPTDLDQVICTTGLAAGRVLSTITALEMRGLIRRIGGRSVQRI